MEGRVAGLTLFITAMGSMCTLLSFDVAKISKWSEVTTPAFVALLLAHLGTVAAAFAGGVLIPSTRNINKRTRINDINKRNDPDDY